MITSIDPWHDILFSVLYSYFGCIVQYEESLIDKIRSEVSCTKQEAREALKQCNDDVEDAISYLQSKNIKG